MSGVSGSGSGELGVALRARRQDLAARLDALVAPSEEPAGGIGFGKRAGDATAAAADRLNDVALATSLRAALSEIDTALARLDDGSYGTCERCGRPIPVERLLAQPSTSRCVTCGSTAERSPGRLPGRG